MAEWELPVDQFTDLGYLFAATTNVVVIHSVEVCLLVFTLDRVSLFNIVGIQW